MDYREGRKLVAYAKCVMPEREGFTTAAAYARCVGWPEGDYHSQSKSTLQQYCYWRGLARTGRKEALIARLVADGCTADALSRMDTNRLAFAIHHLRRMVQAYGDDGMGDQPAGMCRVEYWLAHFDPHQVSNRLQSPTFASCPPYQLRWMARWVLILAATTIQSTARRFLNNKAPPVTHEVLEGPNGEQVMFVYRTAAERQAQIAAYLDAADDSDATVPRSDEETDHDSDATMERSDEEEESDGNTAEVVMGQAH